MIKNIFNMLEFLENDLADTYAYLKGKSKFPLLSAVYNYMIEHSREHAREIKLLNQELDTTTLNEEKVFAFQSKIKNRLIDRMSQHTDEIYATKDMANSEELLGALYTHLAKQFRKIAKYYNGVANDLDGLAEDEYDHRDQLIKELGKIKDISKIKKIKSETDKKSTTT
ncbi:MAG: hypothetical protein QGH40_03655 [bacterium]|jgi:hypothetical protein|nr:hypothetical protein [bacterium]